MQVPFVRDFLLASDPDASRVRTEVRAAFSAALALVVVFAAEKVRPFLPSAGILSASLAMLAGAVLNDPTVNEGFETFVLLTVAALCAL